GIVRSLDDKTTRFVSSRVHQFSHLESIEVYTTRHNVNLVDVLKAMETSKEELPDEKDSSGLRSYFEKVYPELDFDRVYTSDLKKMVKWYAVLTKNAVEIKLSEPPAEEAVTEEEILPEADKEKPVKKASSPKAEITKDVATSGGKKTSKKTAESKSEDSNTVKKAAGKKHPTEAKTVKKEVPAKAETSASKKKAAKPAAKKTAAKKK
ncbi:MAG: hypothetical protein M3N30_10360, partial [Bacteroidota bacterium]|nr:hypothetical protein [Bacteroidota bacterium]